MHSQENSGPRQTRHWRSFLIEREEQLFLALTLVIGALVGMIVVAFILLTERFAARLYPEGGAAWRRVLIPIFASLGMGYLLFRFFRMGAAAEYRRPKPRCTREGRFRSRRFLENFSVPQRPWRRGFRWDAKARRCRWERASPRYCGENWD